MEVRTRSGAVAAGTGHGAPLPLTLAHRMAAWRPLYGVHPACGLDRAFQSTSAGSSLSRVLSSFLQTLFEHFSDTNGPLKRALPVRVGVDCHCAIKYLSN